MNRLLYLIGIFVDSIVIYVMGSRAREYSFGNTVVYFIGIIMALVLSFLFINDV